MSSKRSDFPGHPIRTLLKSAWLLPAIVLLWWIGTRVENPKSVDPYYARVVMLIGINITLAVSLHLINGVSGQFSLGHAGFMAVGAYLASYATATYGTYTSPDDETFNFAQPFAVAWYLIALAVVVTLLFAFIYGLFWMVRQSARVMQNLPAILMVAIVAWIVVDVRQAEEFEIVPHHLLWSKLFALVPTTLDWLIHLGLPSAIKMGSWIPAGARQPVTFLFALLGGGVFAGGAGLIVGAPTLRLRGDYLAIATLGAGEIIRVLINNSEPLGRATGFSGPTYANQPDDVLAAHYIFPWIYGVALITTLLIWRLQYSPKGRAILAVREDEIAAGAMGVDITHHKVIAFVIGAFFAGVAGALYGHYDGYLNPNSFGFSRSIEFVVMVTLGGLGNIWGAIIAAIALTILPEFLRNQPEAVKQSRLVIYAALLVLIMLAKAIRPWKYLLPNRKAVVA